MWNSIIAGVMFQHKSVESLRRELKRNGQLRDICGFDILLGLAAVPTSSSYTRFLKNLFKLTDLIDSMFNKLASQIGGVLADFGEILSFDGKALCSFSNGKKRKGDNDNKKADGMRDSEANWGKKVYKGIKEDGTLWDDYTIKPIIDIRNLWKDGEDTKLCNCYWNVVYNYKGKVFCICPESGNQKEMAYAGFEKERGTLKYRCPAIHYGLECKGESKCSVKRAIRIYIEKDRRIFTPLARSSYAWKREYKKRTAVERVNSRIDNVFGFEDHFIRGLKKMKVRISIALCVMLAMALGRIKEKQKKLMRSFLKSA